MIRFELSDHALTLLLTRAQLDLSASARRKIGEGIRDGAQIVRARAVRNVSGYPVVYDGATFRVVTRTGALKGAIEVQWPYGSPLVARVFVNGAHTSARNTGGYPSKPVPVSRYAAAIEHGHGEIDLKKTMEGKTVPFFGARAKDARGPYAATGLRKTPLGTFTSTRLNRRLAAKGKRPMYFNRKPTRTGSAYFIAFRKVGKTGWIIPAAPPRPFMAAAPASTHAQVQKAVAGHLVDAITR